MSAERHLHLVEVPIPAEALELIRSSLPGRAVGLDVEATATLALTDLEALAMGFPADSDALDDEPASASWEV